MGISTTARNTTNSKQPVNETPLPDTLSNLITVRDFVQADTVTENTLIKPAPIQVQKNEDTYVTKPLTSEASSKSTIQDIESETSTFSHSFVIETKANESNLLFTSLVNSTKNGTHKGLINSTSENILSMETFKKDFYITLGVLIPPLLVSIGVILKMYRIILKQRITRNNFIQMHLGRLYEDDFV